MPKITVRVRACVISFREPSIRLWWAHVIVTPEANRMAVLRSGTSNGSRGEIPVGGQQLPSSGVGARLEW